MDERRMQALMVALVIALVGLVVVQVYWIRSTLELQQERFSSVVNAALFMVSDRMERVEKLQNLKEHEAGRRLIGRLDTLRGALDPSTLQGSAPRDISAMDPVGMVSLAGEHMGEEEQEAFIADLVRSILAADPGRRLEERLDPGLLDSLLTKEMLDSGIEGVVPYGVFSENGVPILLSDSVPGTAAKLARSPFRERLYRHDPTGPYHYLHVLVPGQKRSMLRDMAPMLLAAILLILVVALVFMRTLRIILYQKRLGDIRTDLVNNLTHELKTPISTIGLACEALMDPSLPKTEDQMRSYTAMIRDENKRLGALVENVLQSAVQDSGKMVLKRVQLDLHTLVQDVVRSSSMQVSRRNGVIELDLKAEIHHVSGDRIHLTNLLYNLIDNAVKYCDREPRIRIGTTSDNTGIWLTVADNGIGIAPSEQNKVFDRLYRVPTGNVHNAKGFGLGLSYVRAVVERHGGRIRLESAPGKGSAFHIHLPFEHVPST